MAFSIHFSARRGAICEEVSNICKCIYIYIAKQYDQESMIQLDEKGIIIRKVVVERVVGGKEYNGLNKMEEAQ